MKLRTLLGICLACLVLCLAETAGANLDTAIALSGIYEANYQDSSSGVYEHGKDLFVVVELPRKNNETRKELKKLSRLQLLKELVQWANAKSASFTAATGTSSAYLQQELSAFMAKGDSFFKVNNLNFSILVDRPVKNTYRFVLGGKSKLLYRQLEAYKQASVDYNELVTAYLHYIYVTKDVERLSRFFAETGSEFLAARYALASLQDSYFVYNYSERTNSIVQRRVDATLAGREVTLADAELLPTAPSHPKIMHVLHSSLSSDKVAALSVALISQAVFPESWSQQAISSYRPESFSCYLIKNPSRSSYSPEHLVTISLRSGGCLFMDRSVSTRDSASFKRARTLFGQRGSIHKIQDELHQALLVAPANPDCWDYLAATYVAQKNWRDGAAAYRQLLMLTPFNGEAVARYAECIWQLGFKKQAKWLLLAAQALANSSSKQSIEKIRHRIEGA